MKLFLYCATVNAHKSHTYCITWAQITWLKIFMDHDVRLILAVQIQKREINSAHSTKYPGCSGHFLHLGKRPNHFLNRTMLEFAWTRARNLTQGTLFYYFYFGNPGRDIYTFCSVRSLVWFGLFSYGSLLNKPKKVGRWLYRSENIHKNWIYLSEIEGWKKVIESVNPTILNPKK